MENKKIIIVALAVLVVFVAAFFLFSRESSEAGSAQVAETWVRDFAPTYVYDGFDLAMENETKLEGKDAYEYVFSFSSRAAGYGDRSDQMLAQVITPHTMVVTMESGLVTSAVTDGVYDEMQGELINGDMAADSDTMTLMVYFLIMNNTEEELVRVERQVQNTEAVGRAALTELLAGPFPGEAAAGITTAINEGVEILDLKIEDGVAYADFSAQLDEGVAGSARVMAIRGQIEQTLLQFPEVDSVVISVEGETETILQP